MAGPVPVHEAVEWREPAPGGGSQAQIFRLADQRFAVVKFPENPQGERVLANEFLSCSLAEFMDVPLNRAVLVSIDERLLKLPRESGRVPPTFSAGIRCGMIRFDSAESVAPADVNTSCTNAPELHAVAVFEQLVARGDGRQLLLYPAMVDGQTSKRFAACDYGFAFGGQPNWSVDSVKGMGAVVLPANDPFTGAPYPDGNDLSNFINKLRGVSHDRVLEVLMALHPPRWGVTEEEIRVLAEVLIQRGSSLVAQFDRALRPQMEAF